MVVFLRQWLYTLATMLMIFSSIIEQTLEQDFVHHRNHFYSSLRGKSRVLYTRVQETIYFVLASRTGWVIPLLSRALFDLQYSWNTVCY